MKVFVDSSFWIARISRRDQWHDAARAVRFEGLEAVTSTAIVNESISLLLKRGRLSQAMKALDALRALRNLRIVSPDPLTQERAWDDFSTYGAFGADAVDCLSFATMNREGIRTALTFDDHFRLAGFERIPRLA